MKLWLLLPVDTEHDTLVFDGIRYQNPWIPWYDLTFGAVVRAETELAARQLMSGANDEDIQGHPWLDARFSSCVELTPDGEAGIIQTDEHWA